MIFRSYICLLIFSIPAHTFASSEIFKCTVNGKIVYQNNSCPSENTMEVLHPNGSKSDPFRESGVNMDGWHFGCTLERIAGGFSKSLEEFDAVSVCGYALGVTKAQALKLSPDAEILKDSPEAGMKFIQWIRDDGIKYRLEWKEKEDVISNATLFLNSTGESSLSNNIISSENSNYSKQNNVDNNKDFNDAQICMAAIAMMNGHVPVYDRVNAKKNEVTLSYTRSADKRQFNYDCYLHNNEVKWRLYPQTNWNETNQLFFSINGDSVSVRQVLSGETIDSKSFQADELKY